MAIGAQGSRKLNIPGEENEMVESGIDFLRKVNKTENPNLISGDVVVVGGGNVAIDVARAALRGKRRGYNSSLWMGSKRNCRRFNCI